MRTRVFHTMGTRASDEGEGRQGDALYVVLCVLCCVVLCAVILTLHLVCGVVLCAVILTLHLSLSPSLYHQGI